MNGVTNFITRLGSNGANIQSDLAKVVLIASITKPFVILTGGSGSGKTAIARELARYYGNSGHYHSSLPFVVGEEVGLGSAHYRLKKITRESITIENPNKSLVVFPAPLVQDYIEAVRIGKIDESMSSRDQRDIMKEVSVYDSYFHGWEAQLRGLGYAGAAKPEALRVDAPSNVAIVPVGADWTDNRNVLGFVNHLRETGDDDKRPIYQSTPVLDLLLRAAENENMPHFLILDEMNLSHVERYFSDFLSVMEQRDGELLLHDEGAEDDEGFFLPRFPGDKTGVPSKLPYPKNLFIIGTVNIDETTYMFSPKVLDRANVIEFKVRHDQIADFLTSPHEYPEIEKAEDGVAEAFLDLAKEAQKGGWGGLPEMVQTSIKDHLLKFFDIMQRGRFEFAYRTSNEVMRYLRVCRHLSEDEDAWDDGGWKSDLDDQILQKILPKLHGSIGRIGGLLADLADYCNSGKVDDEVSKNNAGTRLKRIIELESGNAAFPKSFKKLQSMIATLLDEQFVSFIQ